MGVRVRGSDLCHAVSECRKGRSPREVQREYEFSERVCTLYRNGIPIDGESGLVWKCCPLPQEITAGYQLDAVTRERSQAKYDRQRRRVVRVLRENGLLNGEGDEQ